MGEKKDKLTDFYSWKMALIAIAGALLCHVRFVVSEAFGIDTECRIHGMDAYLVQGRPGIYWARNILGVQNFNLYYAKSLTFIFLVLSGWLFLMLFDYCNKKYRNKVAGTIFGLIWVASPFWTAQIYFLGQSAEVLLAIMIIPLTVVLAAKGFENIKKYFYLIIVAVLFMLFICSTYQVNLVIYAMCVCSVFLVKLQNDSEWKLKNQFLWLLGQVGVFIAGALIYIVIAKIFYMSDGNYLYSQIAWKELGVFNCCRNIWSVIKSSILGKNLFGIIYVPMCILLFIISVINDVKSKKNGRVLKYIAMFFMFVSPYIFTIFIGSGVTPRMNYTFPVASAIVVYHVFIQMEVLFENYQNKKIRIVAYLAIVLFILIDFGNNAKIINALYYTEEYRFNKETAIAENLYNDIHKFIAESDCSEDEIYSSMIFIGTVNIEYNKLCMPEVATIGSSNINWDGNHMDRYRIYKFMDDCGFKLVDNSRYYSEVDHKVYYYYFDEFFGEDVDAMPAYPNEGYIQKYLDEDSGLTYTVVKLGNDWRKAYEEEKSARGY